MSRTEFKPGTMIYPLPAVMVSCGERREEYNIATVAWTGTLCTEPPMCYISLRKTRYSHEIISRTKQFVINLTTESLCRKTDWCGVKSGRDFDKFEESGLTPISAPHVQAPYIEESPLSIECQVVEIKELGSHDMFIADVTKVSVDERFVAPDGRLRLDRADLLVFAHGEYFQIGKKIAPIGFSVSKAKKRSSKKTAAESDKNR